jgi:BolA protein
MKIADRLTEDLRTALAADHVEVHDESARHRGHAGALEGGHFDAVIVSAKFEGLEAVERHRAVYAALGDLRERRVHALALQTYTPEEWRTVRRVTAD